MALAYAAYDEVWDEAVRKPKQKKRIDPACALYKKKDGRNKMYDNIIDSYLETDGSYNPSTDMSAYGDNSKRVSIEEDAQSFLDVSPTPFGSFVDKYSYPKPQPCYDEVQGIADDSTARNALEYNRYHDPNNMFHQSTRGQAQNVTREEEGGVHRQASQEDVFHSEEELPSFPMNHQEQITFHPGYKQYKEPKSIHSMYVELALFVLGGILLIFIMEQILNMGVYLR